MTRLVHPGTQWYTLVYPVVLWYTLPLPICNCDRRQYLLFDPEKDKVVKKLEIISLENRFKCILLLTPSCLVEVCGTSSPPTSKIIPPVMAMRDLRSFSVPPHVVHFIPIHATPSPAMDMMMPTIIKARVACSEPGGKYIWQEEIIIYLFSFVNFIFSCGMWEQWCKECFHRRFSSGYWWRTAKKTRRIYVCELNSHLALWGILMLFLEGKPWHPRRLTLQRWEKHAPLFKCSPSLLLLREKWSPACSGTGASYVIDHHPTPSSL